jgi:hydrogenase maturation protease
MSLSTLVLGLGNLLLGDEGVGVHAAQALITEGCPEGTVVLDVGTSILEALPELEQAERVIVIDAVKGGKAPGTIYRMPFEDFAKKPIIASMHGFDLDRVLALTKRQQPPDVLVLGVEPANMAYSLELSREIAGVLPSLLALVKKEIGLKNELARLE